MDPLWKSTEQQFDGRGPCGNHGNRSDNVVLSETNETTQFETQNHGQNVPRATYFLYFCIHENRVCVCVRVLTTALCSTRALT